MPQLTIPAGVNPAVVELYHRGAGSGPTLTDLKLMLSILMAGQATLCDRMTTLEDRILRTSETEKDKPAEGSVQKTVDAMLDHLTKGMTTEKQEASLTKGLQDRRLGRIVRRI